ncbi:MAG: hypothetical protein HY046_00505 [Acidobacteria bacterium]|nr:hypothetical protein [Acidobacteriota bacterium]
MSKEKLVDSVSYWERGRIVYNLLLTALCLTWLVGTWPHFRPAMTLDSLGKLMVLALLANLCYCAAYLIDLPMQVSELRNSWRQRRWILWLSGTLFALLFACYWIADEIYPYVDIA